MLNFNEPADVLLYFEAKPSLLAAQHAKKVAFQMGQRREQFQPYQARRSTWTGVAISMKHVDIWQIDEVMNSQRMESPSTFCKMMYQIRMAQLLILEILDCPWRRLAPVRSSNVDFKPYFYRLDSPKGGTVQILLLSICQNLALILPILQADRLSFVVLSLSHIAWLLTCMFTEICMHCRQTLLTLDPLLFLLIPTARD